VAVLALFCDLSSEDSDSDDVSLRKDLKADKLRDFLHDTENRDKNENDDESEYGRSGLKRVVVESLLGRSGRDKLLSWVRDSLRPNPPVDRRDSRRGLHQPLANKDTLRLALHVVQKYREQSSPSRLTMQKLNRFFMSGPYEDR